MHRIRRNLLRVVLMVGLPAGGLWIAMEAYLAGGRYVTAENAYVKTDIINIGSEVNGRVVEVFVRDFEDIEAGDPLFRIDPEPFAIAVAAADAELAAVRQNVAALRARYHEGEARIRAGEENVRYLAAEHERESEMVAKGVGTPTSLAAAKHRLTAAERELAILREQNAAVLVRIGGSPDAPVEELPEFRAAWTVRREALLDLDHTRVAAPVSGTLSRVPLEAGEYVEAGSPVFALVASGDPWIEVNLKEVDLTHVTVGQAAKAVVDAYPDIVWPAVVHSISPATGAEFALLPPQNSTGNWVKVVQRVPVRLMLSGERDTSLLRSGMTVTVAIDVGRERTFKGVVNDVLAAVLPGNSADR